MNPTLEETLGYALLIGAAFLAGAINTLAGGGTLLTFPSLQTFGGLGAVMANGTSTVALVPGALAGAWGYRRELGEASWWLWLLMPPSIVGGAIGTLLVTRLPDRYFASLVPWLLLTASLLFLAQPWMTGWLPAHAEPRRSRKMVAALVFFQLLVAVYGGYFGAGIGILMLTSLGLMGLGDIHRMNAVKTILAAGINGTSVVVWTAEGRVDWRLAGVMAAGAVAGGFTGAAVARMLPRQVVRWFVIAVGLGLSGYYFWK